MVFAWHWESRVKSAVLVGQLSAAAFYLEHVKTNLKGFKKKFMSLKSWFYITA